MAFDPRVPYWISLDCFADVPEEERPAFQFRRLAGGEFIQLSSIFEYKSDTAAGESAKVFETCKIGLLDWRNQFDAATGEPVPFALDNLERVINAQEAIELIDARLARGRLRGSDKKN